MTATTARRFLAWTLTLIIGLYVLLLSIAPITWWYLWLASWATPMLTSFWTFPIGFLLFFPLSVIPFLIIAVAILALGWWLCRVFGAGFDL